MKNLVEPDGLTAICSECGERFVVGDDGTEYNHAEDTGYCPRCPHPVITDVSKYVHDNRDGSTYEYDDFIHDDGTLLIGEDYFRSYYDVLAWLWDCADDIIEDIPRDTWDEIHNANSPLSALHRELQERGAFDVEDNTYNWGYWGPTVQFSQFGDTYEGLVLCRFHRGGDVRGNYGPTIACPAECLHESIHDCTLVVQLDAREHGTITLYNSDLEAYYWHVDMGRYTIDQTTLDDLEEEFNMNESEYDSLDGAVWW